MGGSKMNHCKIENYPCPNVPDGEICVCIGCGDLYFHDTDDGCYCDNPCQKFDDMQQRKQKQAKAKLEANHA
jgi:hypothetical protein